MGFLSFVKGDRKSDRAGNSRSGKAERLYTEGKNLSDKCSYEEAKRCYEEAIKLDPNYAIAWQNKGEVLEASGYQSEADEAFTKARELLHK